MDNKKFQKLDDINKFLNFKKMEKGSNIKKYENKLEMKEIWKQIKGSSVIREWNKSWSICYPYSDWRIENALGFIFIL